MHAVDHRIQTLACKLGSAEFVNLVQKKKSLLFDRYAWDKKETWKQLDMHIFGMDVSA